jgi:hypothetical protein
MRIIGGKTECLTRTAFFFCRRGHEDSILLLSSRRAVGHESFLSFPAPTAISAIVALASSVED